MHLLARKSVTKWLPGVCLAALLAGCTTGREGQMSPIDALVLLSAPAAVDTDPTPGPDGIAVRLYAMSQSKTKALALTSGRLELLLFDGVLNEQSPPDVKPLHVWSRSASELKLFASKTAIGVSYPLTLLWGESRPRQDMLTIVARYIAPDGKTVYSGPSTIPVGGGARP